MPKSTSDPSLPRGLTDPVVIRALAHPVRVALLEALTLEGPLTATQAGELVGESPANCSFHFRQLAKYGFVEEAGGGRGRQRPWRLKTIGTRLSVTSATAPETALAAGHLSRIYRERALARLREWWATEHTFPAQWREAADFSETIWWVTAEELQQLNTQLMELIMAYRERLTNPASRPRGAVPVEFLGMAFPLRLPDEP